jgi:hypothetical protein
MMKLAMQKSLHAYTNYCACSGRPMPPAPPLRANPQFTVILSEAKNLFLLSPSRISPEASDFCYTEKVTKSMAGSAFLRREVGACTVR